MNLANSEAKDLAKWITKHFEICPHECGEGNIILKQFVTGIGVKSIVECTCGVQHDITDYSIW